MYASAWYVCMCRANVCTPPTPQKWVLTLQEGVGRALSLPGVFRMCSKWSNTGRNASKTVQKGPKRFKRCQKVSKGVKMGQERDSQNGGEEGQGGGKKP